LLIVYFLEDDMKPTPVPVQPAAKRLKNFSEVETGFSKRVAVDEARKFPQSHIPSSQPKCPLGINILEFIRLLREGDMHGAYKKIREESCLPAVCGRLCLAPCEQEYVIGGKKMPIDVRALERFTADHGRPGFLGRDRLTCAKQPVAVIGSGPAGLSAAAILARELYCVTVYESLPQLGGILCYGVPEFRLPKSVLDAEIGQVRDLGVEFLTDVTIGANMTVDDLFAKGFSAVILAAGRSHPKLFDLPGTDAQEVFYAQEVLMKLNGSPDVFVREYGQKIGSRVLVIGSHGEALDCARACRRLGKQAAVVFPGTESDIEAHRNEILYSREEGVDFQTLLKPRAVELDNAGRVKGLTCGRMDFAEKNGQWVLMPVPGAEEVIPADTIILAQGHDVNARWKKSLPGLRFQTDKTVWTDATTGQTSVPGVFAAGDMAGAGGSILSAMISGKQAAGQVIRFLNQPA